jgi:hypothetical protein
LEQVALRNFAARFATFAVSAFVLPQSSQRRTRRSTKKGIRLEEIRGSHLNQGSHFKSNRERQAE